MGRRRAIACPRSRGPSRRAFVGFAPAIPSLKHPARGTVLCRRFSGLRPIVIYNFSRVKGFYGGFFRPSQFQMDDVQGRAVRARGRLAAAPTAYLKVRLIFCRARCPQRAVPGRPGVPPLRNAGIFRFGRRGRRPRRPAGAHCAPLRRPPAILWFLSHRWERNSPRRAKPCEAARPKKEIRNLPPHPPPSGAPSPRGEGFLGGDAPSPAPQGGTPQNRPAAKSPPPGKTFRLFPPAVL